MLRKFAPFVLLLIWVPSASAAIVTFSSEAAFQGAAGALTLESFETLLATNALAAGVIVTPGFDITPNAAGAGVLNLASSGAHATDGTQYVLAGFNNGVLQLTFGAAVTRFGLWVTDWEGNQSTSSFLTFANDLGDTATIVTGINGAFLPDGNELFFGVVSDVAFTTVNLSSNSTGDTWGIDEVQYGSNNVPEPGTLLMLGGGLLGIASKRRRAKRA